MASGRLGKRVPRPAAQIECRLCIDQSIKRSMQCSSLGEWATRQTGATALRADRAPPVHFCIYHTLSSVVSWWRAADLADSHRGPPRRSSPACSPSLPEDGSDLAMESAGAPPLRRSCAGLFAKHLARSCSDRCPAYFSIVRSLSTITRRLLFLPFGALRRTHPWLRAGGNCP